MLAPQRVVKTNENTFPNINHNEGRHTALHFKLLLQKSTYNLIRKLAIYYKMRGAWEGEHV